MRILIVGAGAIGQVYAYCLKQAGNEVHFYVKEKYAQEMQGELTVYPLNRKNPKESPVTFKVDGVVTSPSELKLREWDQVYLCMSSTGLRGDWIKSFSEALPRATVISLQSGMEDREYLLPYFGPERLVSGMLSIISYHAPLPQEIVKRPGMAFWFPPFSPSPFSGPTRRTEEVVRELNRGGYPAKVVRDVPAVVAYPSALLAILIAGLELADWKFDKVKETSRLEEICGVIKELNLVIERKQGLKVPLAFALISPLTIKAIIKLAPRVLPMDIETYLRVHFTKVSDQTKLYLQGYEDAGKELGIPVPRLTSLACQLSVE